MMSGMPLETCCAFNKFWNNKFYYNFASCWLFLLIHTGASFGLVNGFEKSTNRAVPTNVSIL